MSDLLGNRDPDKYGVRYVVLNDVSWLENRELRALRPHKWEDHITHPALGKDSRVRPRMVRGPGVVTGPSHTQSAETVP